MVKFFAFNLLYSHADYFVRTLFFFFSFFFIVGALKSRVLQFTLNAEGTFRSTFVCAFDVSTGWLRALILKSHIYTHIYIYIRLVDSCSLCEGVKPFKGEELENVSKIDLDINNTFRERVIAKTIAENGTFCWGEKIKGVTSIIWATPLKLGVMVFNFLDVIFV